MPKGNLKDGALVTGRSGHHIFVVRDEKLRWVPDAWTMKDEGLSPENLVVLDDDEVAEFEVGDDLPSAVTPPKLKNGTIVETDSGVWRAKGGKLYPILDPTSLQKDAYDKKLDVVWLPESLVRSLYQEKPQGKDARLAAAQGRQ